MESKYDALMKNLENQPKTKNVLSFSFREIETILGSKLPASAFQHRAWWGNQNDRSNRPQAQAWLGAGFIVDSVQQKASSGSVCFQRKS